VTFTTRYQNKKLVSSLQIKNLIFTTKNSYFDYYLNQTFKKLQHFSAIQQRKRKHIFLIEAIS